MTLEQMRQKRAEAIAAARALVELAKSENRALSGEEDEKYRALIAEQENLRSTIEREENLGRLEAELDTPRGNGPSASQTRTIGPSNDAAENAELVRGAFRSYLCHGHEGMTQEERALLSSHRATVNPAELRAMGIANAAGGYTIPSSVRAAIAEGMKAYGGIRRSRAEKITTDGGNPITFPGNDDTGNTGALLAEDQPTSEQTLTMTGVDLEAFTYTSKIIRVHYSLLQDSGVDVEGYIRKKIAERLGRITETHFATGDGSSKPRGITVAAHDSAVNIDISDGLSYANLVDIKHAVDEAHRMNAEWMFHDTMLAKITKLSFSATANYPIWQPSLRDGEPDRILGRPYIVNNSMPQTGTATNRTIIFGDLEAYKVREVSGMILLRLVERYAEYAQVAFVAFMRADGDLVDPGSHPVVFADEVA